MTKVENKTMFCWKDNAYYCWDQPRTSIWEGNIPLEFLPLYPSKIILLGWKWVQDQTQQDALVCATESCGLLVNDTHRRLSLLSAICQRHIHRGLSPSTKELHKHNPDTLQTAFSSSIWADCPPWGATQTERTLSSHLGYKRIRVHQCFQKGSSWCMA